jgi:hypothetical protein
MEVSLADFQDATSLEELIFVKPLVGLLEGFCDVTRNFFDTLELADWAIQGFNQVVVDCFCDGDEVFFAHNDDEDIGAIEGSKDFFPSPRFDKKIRFFFSCSLGCRWSSWLLVGKEKTRPLSGAGWFGA